MDEDIYYSIELNYRGIKMIHEGLRQAVEKWSGGDPHEPVSYTHLTLPTILRV